MANVDGTNHQQIRIALPAPLKLGGTSRLTPDGQQLIFPAYNPGTMEHFIYSWSLHGAVLKKLVDATPGTRLEINEPASNFPLFFVPFLPTFLSINSSRVVKVFLFIILAFDSLRSFDLPIWCLLGLLLKSVSDNNYLITIEKAKYPKNIAAALNPDFIKSIRKFRGSLRSADSGD